jgi:hypothetical protein
MVIGHKDGIISNDPMTEPPKRHLPERYRQFAELAAELDGEIRHLIAETGPDISKVSRSQRRMIVRSVFAFIEAVVFSMKKLAAENTGGRPASEINRAVAAEVTFDLSDQGIVVKRPMKLRLAPNVRFAFRLFKECFNTDSDLDVSGSGWQGFLHAIRVRDRITHPKTTEDISISDEELMNVLDSLSWFRNSFSTAMEEGIRYMNAEGEKLKAQNEELRAKIAGLNVKVPGLSVDAESDIQDQQS